MDYPVPRTQKQIKAFLGMVNYYRKFIPNLAKEAFPVNQLLKKGARYDWTERCQEAFDRLKCRLVSPPVLIFPDFKQEFIITTDASDIAIGGILSQGKIREDLPIAYTSRSLTLAEYRYATIEKELLAIIFAFEQFRPYVLGRKCIVVTDHKPLIYLMGLKDPASRLMRWKLKLSEYDFETVHKPGILNSNADALSRVYISEHLLEYPIIENRQDLKEREKPTSTPSTELACATEEECETIEFQQQPAETENNIPDRINIMETRAAVKRKHDEE